MTSFSWKRKAGAKVSKSLTQAFSEDAKEEEEDSNWDDGFDWLTVAPRKTVISLEDANSKSERLKVEGATLAEAERYWEALKKWEEAIQLAPHNYKILDMKAQALMAVGEVFPAVQTAEKTVRFAPTWWVGHQTLGRALANVGEVRMALKSFSRAVHLNPAESELWTEDLQWVKSLLDRHKLVQQQQQQGTGMGGLLDGSRNSTLTIRELRENNGNDDTEDIDQPIVRYGPVNHDSTNDENSGQRPSKKVRKLPNNYIQMRDPT
ncbi:tetratricopeptide repeat protein 33 [Plakobranchus ocellatus]|uniref:Tetratricopeptide repeat protein 33 n=1 Tax=Plakobranchus ocellatus TaxID=259542 RepID=A0AAV4BP61_9GAST|nr:tetratricopeptide repeat protein 33 [Plakobranchus ocellatus]